jgi:hypothetical protein
MTIVQADSSAAAHPEEIKATVDLRIGTVITLQASARTTPAGVISAGIAAAAMTVAAAYLITSLRRG